MSDLRNFNASNESDSRAQIDLPLSQSSVYEISALNGRPEPLAEFHTIETEEPSSTGRIVGGLVVALMLGSAAVYGFEVSNHPARPVPTQTAVNTPAAAQAAPAPAPAQSADATPATPAPSDTANSAVTPPALAPAPAATPAPMKKAPVRSARVDSGAGSNASAANPSISSQSAANAQPAPVDSSSVQAQQQASSAGTPEQGAVQPVYPTAPSSSLATNNSQPVVPPEVPQPQIQSTPVPAPQPDQATQPASDPSQAAQPSPDQSGQPVQ